MAKLTAALRLSCASAMVYNNPTAVTPRRTGVSFLPVQCRVATKETFAKFVARTHRERSAARHYKVPRHRSAAQFHICRAARLVCEEKSAGQSRSRRAQREPRARRETRASSRKREKTAPRRTRPSSAPRPATRSSRAR